MTQCRLFCHSLLAFALWNCCSTVWADDAAPRSELDRSAPATAAELQVLIERTPAYGTVNCNRNRELVVETTIRVRKPLTIHGLAARLPDKLGKTPLLVVESEGVNIVDFALRGNGDTVEQSERASLLVINAGNFRVEDGRFDNVSQNGLTIEPRKVEPRDVSGGVVRNLVGDGVVRDVVSISGGDGVAVVRNVVVENIQGYRSRLRGAVEVSDGSKNITVRDVYAEDSVYAIDVQDHGKPKQINSNIRIDNVTAVRCRHAVRFNLHDYGHRDISLQNITAVDTEQPLHLKHVNSASVANVKIFGCGEKGSPVSLTNCHGVIVRDLFLESMPHVTHLVQVDKRSDHVLVDGVVNRDELKNLKSVIHHERTSDSEEAFLEGRNFLVGQTRGVVEILNSATNKGTSKRNDGR